MKISVENLGTIHKGEIDLSKDLIIFAGGNNSGKSYMSYLIYGIHSLFNNKTGLWTELQDDQLSSLLQNLPWDELTQESRLQIDLEKYQSIIQDLLQKSFQEVLEKNISTIFAAKLDTLKIDIVDLEYLNPDYIIHPIIQSINPAIYTIDLKDNLLTITPVDAQRRDSKPALALLLSTAPSYSQTYFFPAERSAIAMMAKEVFKKKAMERDELVNKLFLQEDPQEYSSQKLIPRYPMAINDYLHFIEDLKQTTKQPETEFTDLAQELETVLEGKVTVSALGDIEFQTEDSRRLPVHLSASLVKSLSGLVFYLRHLAKKKDVIMIDEPELNLHPENQVKIARVLAKIANRGIKVILSTHSDYLIREFSNLLIMAKDFPDKKALEEKYGYEESAYLAEEKVQVYGFQEHTIQPIPITSQGIEIDKIDKVITDMTQRSDDIYYSSLENLEEDGE